MDQELLKQVTAKANEWLSPAYDAATQAEVKAMLEKDDKTELVDSFYQTSSSVQAVCAVLWA